MTGTSKLLSARAAEIKQLVRKLQERSFRLAARAGGLYIFDQDRLSPEARARLDRPVKQAHHKKDHA